MHLRFDLLMVLVLLMIQKESVVESIIIVVKMTKSKNDDITIIAEVKQSTEPSTNNV